MLLAAPPEVVCWVAGRTRTPRRRPRGGFDSSTPRVRPLFLGQSSRDGEKSAPSSRAKGRAQASRLGIPFRLS